MVILPIFGNCVYRFKAYIILHLLLLYLKLPITMVSTYLKTVFNLKIRRDFSGRKISPIWNFRYKPKIRKFRSNNTVLPLFKRVYTNIGDNFWGGEISPKSKRVNPWFLAIFPRISNFQNNPKYNSLGRITTFILFERLYTNIRENFWRWKISPKSEGANSWFLTIFQPIWNFRNNPKVWKFRSNIIILPLSGRLYTNIRDNFWGGKISQKSSG